MRGGARTCRHPPRTARRHSWMTLPFLLGKTAPADVTRVKAAFEEDGVETRPIIAGNLARHPASVAHKIRCAASLANSDMVLKNGFMIGCHPLNWENDLSILEGAFKRAAALHK